MKILILISLHGVHKFCNFIFFNFFSTEKNSPPPPPPPSEGEGECTLQSFIWEGSAPRSNPYLLYTAFTEKVALSYTFN